MYLTIGHRGAKGHYRENSLRSIRIAKEFGCEIIEIDVRRSKDGHFFLQHDEEVKMFDFTTGEVQITRIEDENFERIRQSGIEQLLPAIMHITDKANVYLDLKIEDNENVKRYADDLIENLKEFEEIGHKFFLASFNKKLMDYLSKKYYDKKYLYGLILDENEELTKKEIQSQFYYFYVFNYNSKNLKEFAKQICKENKFVFLYTLNIIEEMRGLENRGIKFHGIVSDFPDRVKLFCKSFR